jgi:hypothetical protein
MDTNLDVQLTSIPDDHMNGLFGDTPAKAQVDESLVVGSQANEEPKDDTDPEKPKRGPGRPKKDESKEEGKENDEPVNHDVDAHIAQMEGDGPIQTEGGDAADMLRTMAEGLIERGMWSDVNLPEDFEWTDESFGELTQMQATWKAQEMFDEMLDQSGDFGKTIFAHIKNGGNPDELINQFKEIKRVEAYDISTPSGQEAIVREACAKMEWSESRTDKYIKRLVDNNDLEDEAKEAKEALGKAFNDDIETKKKAQEDFVKEQKRLEEEFASKMTTVVGARKDFSDKEKKELLSSILKYDQKLPNGRVVNEFTLNFMKLQADPEKYIELIAFVKNPDKFLEKVGKVKETEAAKKTWNFVKGNGSLNRNSGSAASKSSSSKSDLKIDYKNFNY